MKKARIAVVLLGPILVLALLISPWAALLVDAWSNNPTENTAICTATDDQRYPEIATDGSGGAIITWEDSRSGNRDIYAQRVDSDGSTQWTADGNAICTATSNQGDLEIASDGSGGAIITWHDSRSSGSSGWDIYAQRVDSGGTPQWTTNGVAVCTATGHQSCPEIAADGSGGAIIIWDDYRSGNRDIYAQRVDSDGSLHTGWTANGTAICTATADQRYPEIATDGSGGAIITWDDYRSGDLDIYAQRVVSDGSLDSQLPNQPSNISPSIGATGVSLTPLIQSSAFSDPDVSDTHAASQWQITTTQGDYSSPTFNNTDISNLESINVPPGNLNYDITYYWHVRHQDNHGKWSSYSNETSFTTEPEPTYTLTVNTVGSGSVSKNPDQATYTYLQSVELTAIADPGWTFSGWSGNLTGSANPDTITMNGDKTVTATFTQTPTPTPPPEEGCFIATAAYGTSSAAEIDTLRSFRDEVLLESSLGSQLVDFYYDVSPPIADFISENSLLRTIVREVLVDPIVGIVEAMEALWRH